MDRRQPLPRLWMMTDERQGERLLGAVEALPADAGIVFRHYSLEPAARRALFEAVKALARGRMLLLAGDSATASLWGADGSHGIGVRGGTKIWSAPVHDLREIRQAEASGADLLFLSPVFETRSHPGATTLGPARFDSLAGETHLPVIALGGMDAARFALLNEAYGWAAIDAWSR